MEVTLLCWPADAGCRQALARDHVPRLLLVDGGAEPPEAGDCLEDWIRVPAPEADVRRRIEGLQRRRALHVPDRPCLDGHGVLRFGPGWVPLPPVEARITHALLDRFGAVVAREALTRAGWPEGAPGRNALDVHVLRLRRRLGPVGLAIHTVRSRGYLLEASNGLFR